MRTLLFLLLLFPLFLLAEKKVQVNNRVLAIINAKGISVVDLMKKMDMILYQNHPEYFEIPEARYQFYLASWKPLLTEMLDRELVLLDAEDKKFEVSQGDVREELEEIFGPNVMMNLDNAGLTYDEAFSILKNEITIRRMLYMQVRQKVMATIAPQDIRAMYDKYREKKGDEKECHWSCVTVKNVTVDGLKEVADELYYLLTQDRVAPSDVENVLQKKELLTEGMQVVVSPLFEQKSGEIAENLQELFFSMKEGEWSKPQKLPARAGYESMRLYHIEKCQTAEVETFESKEAELREMLIESRMEEKTKEYFKELEALYTISKEEIEKELPETFQPFELYDDSE